MQLVDWDKTTAACLLLECEGRMCGGVDIVSQQTLPMQPTNISGIQNNEAHGIYSRVMPPAAQVHAHAQAQAHQARVHEWALARMWCSPVCGGPPVENARRVYPEVAASAMTQGLVRTGQTHATTPKTQPLQCLPPPCAILSVEQPLQPEYQGP